MKTLRTSSYLRHVTRHHDSNLPLLKPPRTLTQRWGTMPPHEIATETALPAQHSSVRTGTIPLLQDSAPLSAQHVTELPPAFPTTKTAQPAVEQEATSPSSALPSRLHTPVTLSDSSPVTEETTSTSRHQQTQVEIRLTPAKSQHESNASAAVEPALVDRYQQPQAEIQIGTDLPPAGAPAKSTHSVAAETSRTSKAMQVTSGRQTRTPGKEKPATVTLHPLPRQQQEAAITPTSSRHPVDFLGQGGKASARASEPQRRPAPHRQETQQQHTAIHIGTIDIHIVPPAPPVPLPPARSTTARPHSTSTLSREMTSFIGLRQG